jgi:transposase-like protein
MAIGIRRIPSADGSTGAGPRRTWPALVAAIVVESELAGASVCAVARRHGLTWSARGCYETVGAGASATI